MELLAWSHIRKPSKSRQITLISWKPTTRSPLFTHVFPKKSVAKMGILLVPFSVIDITTQQIGKR